MTTPTANPMVTKATIDDLLALAREAKNWPRVSTLAKDYGLNVRSLRKAIASGELRVVRLEVYRVEPESFAAWFSRRQAGRAEPRRTP